MDWFLLLTLGLLRESFLRFFAYRIESIEYMNKDRPLSTLPKESHRPRFQTLQSQHAWLIDHWDAEPTACRRPSLHR